MDIDQLIAFDRIVREGGFSRAAWELHIAQPTISARIHALEQEVGGPLFARSSRRISLTALGTSFLPYARRAIEVLAEGAAAAREAQDGQRGRLTIGALGSLAGCLLAPALAQFQRGHPRDGPAFSRTPDGDREQVGAIHRAQRSRGSLAKKRAMDAAHTRFCPRCVDYAGPGRLHYELESASRNHLWLDGERGERKDFRCARKAILTISLIVGRVKRSEHPCGLNGDYTVDGFCRNSAHPAVVKPFVCFAW